MAETKPLLQGKPQGYNEPPQSYMPPQPGYGPPQATPPYQPPPTGGYAPPPTAGQPIPQTGYQTTNVTVVKTAPTVTSGGYGYSPVTVTCPTCHNEVSTRVSYEAGGFAWMIVFILFLVGWIFPILWFGICLIPLFVTDCKDAIHTCPVCNTRLGEKKRSF